MSNQPLPNLLCSCRKGLGLTQGDVAYLLGCHDGGKVSRYERFVRKPTLKSAIACEIIFNMPCDSLFPGILREVQANVSRRSKRLTGMIARRPDLPNRERRLNNLHLLAERCASRRTKV